MDFLIILIWILSILTAHILIVKVLEIQDINKDLIKKLTGESNTEIKKSDDVLEKELLDYIEKQDDYVEEIIKDKSRQDIEEQEIPLETYTKESLEKKIKTDLFKPYENIKVDKNITLDAKYDIPTKSVIQESQPGANTLGYKTLKPDKWFYQNEKVMNGGIPKDGSVMAFDSESSYNYVSI